MSEGDRLRSLVSLITHDLNNSLTALLGNISLASMIADGDGQEVGRILADAEVSAKRMRLFVEQLRAIPDVFAPSHEMSGVEPEKECADPALVVGELLQVAPCRILDSCNLDRGRAVTVRPAILRLVLSDLLLQLLKTCGERCEAQVSLRVEETEAVRMRIVAVDQDDHAQAAFRSNDEERLDLLSRLLEESGCRLSALAEGENGFELLMPPGDSEELAR
jgi:hypothetical protein